MKKNDYTLGLDIGITSVGFGIINSNYEVINYGVRLFDEANADDNLTRRTKRGSRRLKSRKRNRINAIRYYLLNNNIISSLDYPIYNNVYDLRIKGLHNKLNSDELVNVLVNIAKHRGSSLDVVVDEDDKDAQQGLSALTDNTRRLIKENKFVCELQKEKMELSSEHKLRDNNNVFKTSDYEKELRQILLNQGLTDKQNEDIVNIVIRRRNFSEGPGSEEFPTPYGQYRLNENNEVIKVNLIDEMRGKCSIYPNELRIAKNSYEACLFNLLNDLNNISYIKDGEKSKLTLDEKIYIINTINEKGTFNPNQLAKYIGIDLDKIEGFRLENNKPILSKFDIYSKVLKSKVVRPEIYKSHYYIDEKGELITRNNNFDKIIELLTKVIVIDERKTELKKLNIGLNDEEITYFANLPKINGYHSLSQKAMDEIIPELVMTTKNQMQIIQDFSLNSMSNMLKSKSIQFDDSYILSPVVKRMFRQTLLVINTLRSEYGEFDSIVIEMAREKNSQEEKKAYESLQKKNAESKAKADDLILQMDKNPNDFNLIQRLKLRLYNEQMGKTIYTGETINLDTLLNDPTAYQIEHIIPYSISFDNSLENKALASHAENQEKGNKTPFEYFMSGCISSNKPIHTFEQFEEVVNSLQISKKKKANLLNKTDISKFSNMEEFVERNLNDTRYGTRCVLNTLNSYYKANDIDTKVFTIKGNQTHAFRSKVGLIKDRDVFIHHAIDALIIAGFRYQKEFYKAFKLETEDGITYQKSTGEVIDFDNPLEDSKFIMFVKSLKQIEPDPMRFSYKIDTKTNRKFSDETIYSTRIYDDKEYLICKYKDIYGKEGLKLKEMFYDSKNKHEYEKLLVFKNDKQTFELLKSIVESYKEQDKEENGKLNPFEKYKEEHGYIRKYSKDGNGPIIKSIKYVDSLLGNHLSISKNYKLKGDKNVVLLQTTPYRTDVYQSPDGLYKFITIRRYQVTIKDNLNYIDEELYNKMKEAKNINSNDKFLFSLNRNNIIKLINKDNTLNGFYKFKVTNNDLENKIEIAYINKITDKRMTISIGKKILTFEKYNVSPIGKYSKVISENLKLKW